MEKMKKMKKMKIEKVIVKVLSMAMVLSMLCSMALAGEVLFDSEGIYDVDGADYMVQGDWEYSMNDSAVMDDGTVYFIVFARNTSTDSENVEQPRYQLWKWDSTMEKPAPMADDIFYCYNASTDDDMKYMAENYGEKKTDLSHPISCMFSIDGKLASFNPRTGVIYTVDSANGKLTFTDVVTMSSTKELLWEEYDGSMYYTPVEDVTCMNGSVLMLSRGWDESDPENVRLLSVNLKNGNVEKAPLKGVQSMKPYKDGKLMLTIREVYYDNEKNRVNPFEVYSYDVKNGKTKKLLTIDNTAISPNSVIFSRKLDSFVWVGENKVMSTKDGKKIKQVGYSPSMSGFKTAKEIDGRIYADAYNSMVIIDLDPNFSTDKKVNAFGTYHNTAAKRFFRDNPDTPVYQIAGYADTAEELGKRMVSGDDSLDVIQVGIDRGDFINLSKKGYCMDLSGSQIITDFVNDLYPPFRDLVMKDGKIIGIPVNAASYDGYSVNMEALAATGLTMDDMPTNIVDLCAFVTKWNNEWMDKYQGYTPIAYVSDFKAEILDEAIRYYMNYCVSQGVKVDFSTPLFREMMTAVDQMQCDNLTKYASISDEDSVQYRTGLLEYGHSTVGTFFIDRNYTDLNMGLTKDVTLGSPVHVTIMFVNPKSKNPESAVKYLEYQIKYLGTNEAATLCMSRNQPVENKYYPLNKARLEKRLKLMEEKLTTVTDEDEKADVEAQIESIKQSLEDTDIYGKYSIDPECIERYVTKYAPTMFVKVPAFSNDKGMEEIRTLEKRYCERQISMEQFIKEATNKANMMSMEME